MVNALNEYELVINVADFHINQIVTALPFIMENLQPKSLVIISSNKTREVLENIFKFPITFVDEDQQTMIDRQKHVQTCNLVGVKSNRINWYFQQFLKMGYSFHTNADFYVVWDADTIPLKKILFKDGNKFLFNRKGEHHPEYFITIKNILGDVITHMESLSFITEYMPIDKMMMMSLISEIERANPGCPWYETIIKRMDNTTISGFSEFETYGNYVANVFPNSFRNINLKTERYGMIKFSGIPNFDVLKSLDLDTISFEKWQFFGGYRDWTVLDERIMNEAINWQHEYRNNEF